MALMVEASLGLGPWDVFHQGLSERTGASLGTVTIAVGALVLLLWIPLRQRPGLGTVSNVVVIGLAVDLALALLPTVEALPARIAFLVAGITLNGMATGLYIGARLGPGPRDGLMTGYVARRPHRSLRLVRTVIELTVLAIGFALGGKVGIGTLAYALAIGPLVHAFIPMFTVPPTADGVADGPDDPDRPDGVTDGPGEVTEGSGRISDRPDVVADGGLQRERSSI
ncbi:hypothetical protein O7626_22890 [Micromonospora sp. WMMD1102]|uniref:membrane protein YczE n=1 Tax=Micromonospora sp. WMMD1102 TaxID=3016105 RepID=UPI002414FE0D|nr:hypothetical protein [Micromonospora sp. WMMD1102]MDG4788735.1 hypothetical protein [Micromonospora sp. WMMD1102]